MQALLNSSQKYHDALKSFSDYGVEVDNVRFVLDKMMAQKDKAVNGLTSGIEGLFKKNKVRLAHTCKWFTLNLQTCSVHCLTVHLVAFLPQAGKLNQSHTDAHIISHSDVGDICQRMGCIQERKRN